MKLANFEWKGVVRAGVVGDGWIFEVPTASSVQDMIEKHRIGLVKAESKVVSLSKVRLRPPILYPDKILLAAVNYRAHGSEQSASLPKEPYFFTKFSSCIIGNGDPIILPKKSTKVDWEVELVAVIGRKCKYVKKKDALDHVAGYTVANDVSFRDFQFPEGWPKKLNTLGQNWVIGKALDSAYPLGPWLVTPDELGDPQRLQLSLTVNGVGRQSATTGDMVFTVAELIEYLSNRLTLLPGDIISTGTPAGVAAFTGVPYLKDGDVVEANVEKIGVLRNPVSSEN